MTRLPQLTGRELAPFLKSQGFVEDRWAGSYLTLRHEAWKVTGTTPVHSGVDVGRGLPMRILRDAGFSAEDFMRLR